MNFRTDRRPVLAGTAKRHAVVERWLRDEVVSVHNVMEAGPGRARSTADVFGTIRARHAKALSARS